jgi:phage terminase large subunit-like protein
MIRDNRFSIMLFSRQTGKSTLATIFMLWIAIFQEDQRILLVANKESTAKEIFRRIRVAYEALPNWLKAPVSYYGLESLELQNGSRISITTTTGTAGRGSSANLLFVDEMDFIEKNMLEEFWSSVYPIISASKKSKIIVASTPKDTSGLLYKLYDGSVKKTNNWVNMKVLWNDVPDRDEKWRNETINALGDVSMFKREFECVDGKTLVTILNNSNEEQQITIEELYEAIKN